jgi:hypothetical protein
VLNFQLKSKGDGGSRERPIINKEFTTKGRLIGTLFWPPRFKQFNTLTKQARARANSRQIYIYIYIKGISCEF